MRSFLVVVAAGVLGVGGCGSDAGAGAADAGGGPDASTGDAGTNGISGRVEGVYGVPQANVRVAVLGRAEVLSDADGRFSFADVTTPYDFVAISDDSVRATVWKGVTRRDPLITYSPGNNGPDAVLDRSATITGDAPPNSIVGFGLPQRGYSVIADTAGSIGAPVVHWAGAATVSASVHALTYDPSGPSYMHGAATVDVADGASASVSVSVSPATSGQLQGTITAPATFDIQHEHSVACQDHAVLMPLLPLYGTGSTFDVTVPSIPGCSSTILARAMATDGSGQLFLAYRVGRHPGDTVDIVFPDPPILAAPANATSNVGFSTSFSWSEVPGATYEMVFTQSGVGTQVDVTTAEATTTIPDLSAYGIPMAAGATYTWFASAWSSWSSVDDLLVEGLLPLGTKFDVTISPSLARAFDWNP